MAKHAIVIATREWCEAAASGRIKVYDFKKRRKLGIRALAPGSICIVMTKSTSGEPAFCGEFTVREVKEVGAREYNRLASRGLIHKPQKLKRNERRWIILFDEFKKYKREVLKEELTDVKTPTSNRPIAERRIIGLTYIDEHVVREIRRRAGELPPEKELGIIDELMVYISLLLEVPEDRFHITRTCAEYMLMSIGRDLGFKVYTADPSRECSGRKLKNIANMSKVDLGELAGQKILNPLSRIDVVWYSDEARRFYAFEVVIGDSMDEALRRLSAIGGLEAKLFIVSGEGMRREYERSIQNPAFNSIRRRCLFISLGELAKMYILTRLWKRSVEVLQLPYTSR